jgi:hypothetical protein
MVLTVVAHLDSNIEKFNKEVIFLKRGSLVYQINQRFKALEKFGESKHKAKKEYKDLHPKKTPKTEGIYSYKTMAAYRQTLKEFTPFLKEKRIKDIREVDENHIKEYLQNRQKRGLSPYTLSKDMAAFNKFFGLELTKQKLGLHTRSYRDITQNRGETKEGLKYNPKNWERQIAVVKNFGVRRESVLGGSFQLKTGSLYKTPDGIYVSVIEKNGKFRNVQCLKSGQKYIEKLFPDMPTRSRPFSEKEFRHEYKNLGEYLFNRFTKKIRSHQLRAEFARNLYEEKIQEMQNPVKDYKGYNEEATREVSRALGHNRPSVVVYHYFR